MLVAVFSCAPLTHACRPVDGDVVQYDVTTHTWARLNTTGTAPTPRLGHGATTCFDALYVFGGRCGKEMGEGAMGDMCRCAGGCEVLRAKGRCGCVLTCT